MSSTADNPYPNQPAAAPAKPKKRRRWLRWAIPVITFLLGLGMGSAGNSNTASTATSTATTTVTATTTATTTANAQADSKAAPTATVTATKTVTASAAAAAPASTASAQEWTDGTYEVGTGKDIAPGRYKVVPGDTGMCYWATLKDADGSLNSIIANDNITGPSFVTIKPAVNYFEVRGCTVTKA